MHRYKQHKYAHGFTLVEMLVVAPIVILAIGAFLTAIISMTGEVIASRASNALAYNTQDALNRIEQDVKNSSSFLAANSITPTTTTAQGYNNDTTTFTNIAGASGTSLILNMVATDSNPNSASAASVYLKDQPNSCAAPRGNIPFTYNVIYFTKDDPQTGLSTLWRRTMMPTNYDDTTNLVCAVPFQQPSCAPSYMEAQSGASFCKTSDIKLVAGIKPGDFVVSYFNNAGSTAENIRANSLSISGVGISRAERQIALQSATTVNVGLSASQSAGGRDVARTGTLRASRLVANAPTNTPIWTPLAFKNGWTNYGNTYAEGAYTKTSAGLVALKGLVKSGSSNVIAVLPVGYRPASNIIFEVASNSAAGRLDIYPDGSVYMYVGVNSWFSLEGISFMPAGTSFTTPPLLNGWLTYGGSWAAPGYMTDSLGRVQTTGLIKGGTTTSPTPMFNLPAGSRPNEYIHILNDISNLDGHIGIDATGNVNAKGYSNSFSSLQAMFYPAGRATGTNCTTQWCALPLINGWKWYGGQFSQPQYTKAADGIVSLKGLIAGGISAGSSIVTLPAGYCPADRLLLSTVSATAWARIDIILNSGGGCYLNPSSGVSTSWLSLDDIHYVAEQ